MTRFALTSLATMALASSLACRADDAATAGASAEAGPAAPASDATATPSTLDAATPRASRHRPAKRLTVAQSIDENVRRLTRGLDLDPAQQVSLRQILVVQHRQIMKLRSGDSAASGDVTGTTLAIYDQTKARIRAMLNDEQKKKYSVDVSRDSLAPAQADLKHWMDLQETKRRQGQSEDESK